MTITCARYNDCIAETAPDFGQYKCGGFFQFVDVVCVCWLLLENYIFIHTTGKYFFGSSPPMSPSVAASCSSNIIVAGTSSRSSRDWHFFLLLLLSFLFVASLTPFVCVCVCWWWVSSFLWLREVIFHWPKYVWYFLLCERTKNRNECPTTKNSPHASAPMQITKHFAPPCKKSTPKNRAIIQNLN